MLTEQEMMWQQQISATVAGLIERVKALEESAAATAEVKIEKKKKGDK